MINYYLFPFAEIKKGENVIIWGYGWVGKCYVEQVTVTNYCKIYAVVDINYDAFNNITVASPEIIKEKDDIKIVIAQSNGTVANEIIQVLKKWGIEQEQIIYKKNEILIGDSISGRINQTLQCVADMSFSIKKLEEKMDYQKRIITSIESDLRDERGYVEQSLRIHLEKIFAELKCYDICGYKKIRMGNSHDGGYVLVDNIAQKSKIAYSFGISNDISWDKEMSEKGMEVFMYDHTVDVPEDMNGNMHFFNIGICGSKERKNEKLKTINEIIESNGHAHNNGMILKMDIEGDEYDFLLNIDDDILTKFDQIVMELHHITDCDMTDEIVGALKKINRNHRLIHIHGNNYSTIRYVNNKAIPDSVEVSYVLASAYEYDECESNKYRYIDKPNDKERLEVIIE